MNKPTKEEMKKWLLDFDCKYYSIGLHFPQLIYPPTERDKEMFKAIMDVIENMDKKPKVSREFIRQWQEKIEIETDAGGTVYPASWQLKAMLTELGHEVEEEEGDDE